MPTQYKLFSVFNKNILDSSFISITKTIESIWSEDLKEAMSQELFNLYRDYNYYGEIRKDLSVDQERQINTRSVQVSAKTCKEVDIWEF